MAKYGEVPADYHFTRSVHINIKAKLAVENVTCYIAEIEYVEPKHTKKPIRRGRMTEKITPGLPL